MFDREKLIEAAEDALWRGMPWRYLGDEDQAAVHRQLDQSRLAEQVVDAVLAALSAQPEQEVKAKCTCLHVPDDPSCPIHANRAALAADRESEPVQITDEIEQRLADWLCVFARSYRSYIQLPGNQSEESQRFWRSRARAALAAALSAPPPEGESE